MVFEGYEEFFEAFPYKVFSKCVVIAATAELGGAGNELAVKNSELKPLLHAQSYEPDMIDDPAHAALAEAAFKAFPVFSNSAWITKSLEKLGVQPFTTVSPGVNTRLSQSRELIEVLP